MNNGLLIACPNCQKLGIKQILGRVTELGFVVLRFHNATTVIQAAEYTVVCQCGFGTTLYQAHSQIAS